MRYKAVLSLVVVIAFQFLSWNNVAGKTLRIGLSAPPPGLGNPLSSTGTSVQLTWAAIFDSLTMIDNDGSVEPWLATSWQFLGSTRWRFSLRDDVTFSNGRRFDAATVKAVLDYLISDDGVGDTARREVQTVAGIEVLGPYSVEIITKYPDPNLPRSLAAVKIPDMIHWAEVGRGGFALDPIGTGPFKVDSWQPARISLSAHKGSWHEPMVDALELIIITDPATRLQAFLADQIDIAFQLSSDDISAVESVSGRMFVRPLFGVLAVTFQTLTDTPFKDVRVRKAMNFAVNRQEMVDALLGGKTQIATQPAPRHAYGYDPTLEAYPYNPEQARLLLNEAGYPDGFEFDFEGVIGTGPNDAMIYQKVAADLTNIGVKMNIKVISYPQLISKIYNGGWKSDAFGMDYAVQPSMNALRAYQLHSCEWQAAWYCDQAITPVLQAARTELDDDKRLNLTRRVVRHHHSEAQSLFLFDQIAFDALNARVRGYAPRTVLINYDAIDLSD